MAVRSRCELADHQIEIHGGPVLQFFQAGMRQLGRLIRILHVRRLGRTVTPLRNVQPIFASMADASYGIKEQ